MKQTYVICIAKEDFLGICFFGGGGGGGAFSEKIGIGKLFGECLIQV